MSDIPPLSSEENPRDRFRRLLSVSEEQDQVEQPSTGESVDQEDKPEIVENMDGLSISEEPMGTGEEDVEIEPAEPPTLIVQSTDIPEEGKSLESDDQPSDTPQAPVLPQEPSGAEPADILKDQIRRRLTPTPPAPPPLGTTPQTIHPAIDADGMPLPRRVDEIDMNATRVSPAAVQSRYPQRTPTQRVPLQPKPRIPVRQQVPSQQRVPPVRNIDWKKGFGCLLRMTILALFGLVVLIIIGGTIVLGEYYSVAATIPNVDDLRARTSQFETTRILDRNGNVLYEILDPNAGRRTYVPLTKISPYLVAATIATEDKNFYTHPGFDPMAILRAFIQNMSNEGETVSGASTITQQLARNLLFTPEERVQRTYLRKVREALAAAEITRRYSKDEILEIYLNENFYGNLSYGVEAAAETYFKTTADKLTIGQSAFLAGLPQAPSIYDIYNNREVTLVRLQQVLIMMNAASQEQGCIFVSNNPQPICVATQTALDAYDEIRYYTFTEPVIQMRYPHWVTYIQSILEEQYDAQTIYRSGFNIYTTLDPGLQDDAERILKDQVAKLAENKASSGALVAIRPGTGEILAMVGSADFFNNTIDGQVNMAVSPTRQPGSAIKPLTYLAAFEKGWTPATLIWDVPSEFPPSGDPLDPSPPYKPVNYDDRFHGPVTVRYALANSYNIPAVKALQFSGIYDNPDIQGQDGLIGVARRLGITSFTRSDYGLALTLGGGEVSLLEMTGAYAVLANGGLRVPTVPILRIIDRNGEVVYEYETPAGEQVVRAEHAFLISSILSDNTARTPAFGPNSLLNLPFTAAAKTGTTNDFRDNWTIGYTPDIAVGVWIGNPDYTPMVNTSGLTGAAPIWSEFMQVAVQKMTGNNPRPFFKPAGIVDRVICAISGTEPSQWCPNQRGDYFTADQPPLPKEQDLWGKMRLDTWTGLRASSACGDFATEEFVINVTDPWAVSWINGNSQGNAWAEEMGFQKPYRFAPSRECRSDDPRPLLELTSPRDGQKIDLDTIDIFGKADATTDFRKWALSYGLGDEPVEWKLLYDLSQPVNQLEKLFTWKLSDTFPEAIPTGTIVLQLRVNSIRDTYAEKKIKLNFQVPTPTPTPSPTATPTPTLTNTATPTATPTLTGTPTSTPTVTQTLLPTYTYTPTETPTNTPTASPTTPPPP